MRLRETRKAIAKWIRRVGLTCFVAAWLLGMLHHMAMLNAGGRPFRVDSASGKYYVKEKNRITEVSEATYLRLIRIVWFYENGLPVLTLAMMGSLIGLGIVLVIDRSRQNEIDVQGSARK